MPDAVAEECDRWAEAGIDLGIVYLPHPALAEHLPAVAEALAPLAAGT